MCGKVRIPSARKVCTVCMHKHTEYRLTQNTLQLQSTVKPVWGHLWATILCPNERWLDKIGKTSSPQNKSNMRYIYQYDSIS